MAQKQSPLKTIPMKQKKNEVIVSDKKKEKKMIPESSKKKQQTKRPSKTEESKHWSLSGEILVVSDKKPPVRSQIKAFSTFHLTMDQNGQMFSPASLEVDFNGKREIVTLSSHQVKLILNVLGYVKHVKVD